MRIFLLLSFAFISNFSFSQKLVIRDSQEKTSIPFVNIISDEGKLVGLSDINGVIDLTKISNSLNSGECSLTFQHISYDNLFVNIRSLQKINVVELTKRKNILPEVIVKPNNQFDYLVLKGYFRSYQLEDSVAKYYLDGIIEFHIPRKGTNIKSELLALRSFKNDELISKEKQRKFMVSLNGTVVPEIESKSLIEELGKKYSIKEIDGKSVIIKNDSTVGIIKKDTTQNILEITVNTIAPAKEEVHKLVGYTTKIACAVISENYSGCNTSSIIKCNLISRKEYRKIYFSHKKSSVSTDNDIISELYIVEKEFLTNKELKERKKQPAKLRYAHLFSNEYWNDFNKYNIPPLSQPIDRLLGDKLKQTN